MEDYLFFVVAFLASVVSGVVGFGTGLILISVGSFFYDIKETIVLANIFFIGVTLSRAYLFRADIDWRMTKLMLVLGLPMVVLGASLLVPSENRIISLILGSVILVYIANVVFGIFDSYKATTPAIVLGGGVWGLLGGFVGDGNVVKAAIFDHIGMTKETFVATMAFTSLLANIAKYAVYGRLAIESQRNPVIIIGLFILAFIGSFVGKQLLSRVSPIRFRAAMLLVLSGAALKLIIIG